MGIFGVIGSIIGGIIGGPPGAAIGGALGGAGGGGSGGSGGVTSVSVVSMPCPQVSDAGLAAAWTWSKAGAMLVAAASAKASYDVAKDRHDIAKRYKNLAKDEWDFFYDNYRPVEREEMAEIRSEATHVTDYIRSVTGHLKAVDPVFANIDRQRIELGAKFCVCPDAGMMTHFEVAKSTVSGDIENFARKYAETWTEEKNDIRFARRTSAANRGRSLLSESTAMASRASSIYGEYADGMTSVAQGAAQFLGYIDKRRPTQYPDRAQYSQGTATGMATRQGPIPPEFDWSLTGTEITPTPNITPIVDNSVGSGGFGEPSIQQ